eukprot:TRINITY_DN31558_c0_g2_i1.p1 TRINITY_DN31558_c0_g2~~TRINITY_DN31558_c0_g2_i1.p1  ORF type:complete len:292 (+),score=26.30 TRINITY_DN31558_c0_g2_i1:67-876(+)
MCNNLSVASGSDDCAGSVVASMFTCKGRDIGFCGDLLEPGVYWDSQSWFRMDGYIPREMLGGLLVQFPHQVNWDETVNLTLTGLPQLRADVYFFYNNASIDMWTNYFHLSREDAIYCAEEFSSQLQTRGFEGPSLGPQYDVHSTRWPGHGNESEMWRRRFEFDDSGTVRLSIRTRGTKCFQTAGIVIKGPCTLRLAQSEIKCPSEFPVLLSILVLASLILSFALGAFVCCTLRRRFLGPGPGRGRGPDATWTRKLTPDGMLSSSESEDD